MGIVTVDANDMLILHILESMRTSYFHMVPTPLGEMIAVYSDDGIHLLEFFNPERIENQTVGIKPQPEPGSEDHPVLSRLRNEIELWFSGELKAFSLPLIPNGSEFQLKVWEQLKKIPYGTTISYEQLAEQLGERNMIRAAASANGANPIAIMIPCHRVIGKDGSLTGYAGGLKRKRQLLDHERRVAGDKAYKRGDQMELM